MTTMENAFRKALGQPKNNRISGDYKEIQEQKRLEEEQQKRLDELDEEESRFGFGEYERENEYGYKEYANEPQEISNAEVAQYLDVILMAIEENNLPEEEQRGLMRYYDDHDSVNAKVSKYVFSVELVEGELMGVAVLILNNELTPKELEKIKENVTGQASDGYVPRNNMGPRVMEML